MNPWSVALGVVLTGALSYYAVPLLVEYVDEQVRKQLGRDEKVGQRLVGGDFLGYLECALYFGALLWTTGGIALIAAWLVFKTAAKWKTMDSAKEHGVSMTEVQMRYRGFVIGTAANLVAALAGVAVAHLP